MGAIVAKSGSTVTLGIAGGYPTRSSWGDTIASPDAGVPLLDYSADPIDPLTIWKTQPSVRKVVDFAARSAAAIPWHAYERVGDEDRRRLHGSPIEELLESPTALTSGFQLMRDLVTDRLVFDLCLAVYAGGDLVRIPPHLVRVQSDHFGTARKITLRTPAGEDELDVTDAPKILTWGWHSKKSGGVSPMHTLAEILEENRRAVQWRREQWTNSPRMSGLLERPASDRAWKPEHRERFEREWAAWKSTAKAGGTPILEGGMTYKPLEGLNPKDANDVEGRRLTDIEVASAFHIPPELVGAREGTFSNIDAFRQMLYGPTLGPLFTDLKMAIRTGGLVPAVEMTPGVYVEANREAGMAGSFAEQARTFQTMTGGPVMTRAEARARLNLEFIDGTDELVVPMNVTEGGLASPTDTGAQNVGGDNADPEAREDQP